MMTKKDITLSVLSGILLVAGFPQVDLYPLSWIAIVPLLISLLEKDMKASFFLGILSGFIYFLGTIFWVFNSIYYYGHLPAFLGGILVAALCLYLGSYVGVFAVFFNYLTARSRFPALFIAPVLWVTLEFLRTYVFTGFPWSVLGYSQYKFLALIQIADITGVYGVSFLIAAVNGAVFDVFVYGPRRHDKMPLLGRWHMTAGLIILGITLIASVSYGIWRLNSDSKGSHTIRAGVVQGNIEQDKKWDINFQRETIDTYKSLAKNAMADSPSLIVWPETAVPFIFGSDNNLTSEIREFQKSMGVHLIFGSVTVKGIKNNTYQLSNSSILLAPDGTIVSVYDKIHLVPYGEYVPLRNLFPFINKLVEGIENRVPVIRAANTGISGFIDAKGRIIRKSDIFVTSALTEDLEIGSFSESFYSKYGDLFVFFCIISCILLIANSTGRKI
ncbi:MAG: apolipoprotein N-acyltransferase [Nitrospirae bacterium]|nr:apolipoprotein N-acyltransferase [Nitrospirota bacterium]